MKMQLIGKKAVYCISKCLEDADNFRPWETGTWLKLLWRS